MVLEFSCYLNLPSGYRPSLKDLLTVLSLDISDGTLGLVLYRSERAPSLLRSFPTFVSLVRGFVCDAELALGFAI
jgi:hypothetical protein